MTAGRPSKLTPEIQEEIIKSILAGNYIETAAAANGISKSTFYGWLKKGARAKTNTKFKKFLNAVKRAEAEAEAKDLRIISDASEKYWQAAAWRLERKHPDRWGKRDKMTLEHSGEVNSTITFNKDSQEQILEEEGYDTE